MYNNMNNNNIIEVQRQESLKRRWHDSFYTRLLSAPTAPTNPTTSVASSSTSQQSSLFISKPPHGHHHHFLQPGRLDGGGGDLVLNAVPSITVVLEGRSICHRINLLNHGNYQSLAKALRQMFVEIANIQQNDDENYNDGQQQQLDLSNAVPGYVIAYEDMENDLLLAGDLQWKDFVRVAKRIRILPVKSSSRKQKSTKH